MQNGMFVTYNIEEVGGVLTGKHSETKERLFNKYNSCIRLCSKLHQADTGTAG